MRLCFLFVISALGARKTILDEDFTATSLVQIQVEALAPVAASQCMADDLEKIMKGVKDSGEQHLNKFLGFPMILLLAGSLVLLFFGHRLVTPVILLSTALSGFFVTFELIRSATHHCSAPVWAGIIVAILAAAAAVCFLEATRENSLHRA